MELKEIRHSLKHREKIM